MKNPKLILLIVLVTLILGYLILRSFTPKEKLSPILDFPIDKINTVEIWDKSNRINLIQKEGEWRISKPLDWKADTLRVNNFIKDVLTAKYPTTPMSIGKDAVSLYGLDKDDVLNIRVTAGAKKNHLQFSNLGNPWDYFRFAEKSEVYQIKSKVLVQYYPELSNWRSPEIVRVEESELISIDVTHPKNHYTLTRKDNQWNYTDKMDSFNVPYSNIALIKILNILQNFNTYVFIDGNNTEYRKRFENPDCTIKLSLTNNRKQTLSFIKMDDNTYLLKVDDDDKVLFSVSFDSVFRFIRHAEVFRRLTA